MKKVSLILALVLVFAAVFGPGARAQKRVSPQAKGAIIGGLGGAAAGALINKRNRAVGGVVGGVVGGGAGYLIGKKVDNNRKAEAARVVAARRASAQREAAYRAGLAKESAAKSSGTATGAKALTAEELYTLNTSLVTPAGSGVSYLPNKAYGTRSSAYPSSEIRRKSW